MVDRNFILKVAMTTGSAKAKAAVLTEIQRLGEQAADKNAPLLAAAEQDFLLCIGQASPELSAAASAALDAEAAKCIAANPPA